MLSLFAANQTSIDIESRLYAFGYKLTLGGAHSSRTMMLDEITRILIAVPVDSPDEAYRQAILEMNLLGKKTIATREKTMRYLRELYGLSESIPIFSLYRKLCAFDPKSAPLLSLMVSLARDPQLRATADVVLNARTGDIITGEAIQDALRTAFQNRYSQNNIGKISRNAASSWTQAGYLSGRTKKIRIRSQPGPAAMTLCLILGHLGGWHGEQMLTSTWCRILDLSFEQARTLALAGNREGLISMKIIDTVVEIAFPRFDNILRNFA
jgi:hypothetical protein